MIERGNIKNRNYKETSVLVIALSIILFLGFFSIVDKSMTWDEKCYIGAGKYILKTGNLKYNALRAHPPLSFYINSIFLLPFRFGDEIYSNDDCWEIGYDMAYHSGYNPKVILTLARLPFIIMSMILALYLFSWAKRIYGVKSGYLALVLYVFSTAMISQSNLAMTDFTVTFFIFLTMYYYWKFRTFNKKLDFYLVSLFLGFSLLSKLTGLILVPILLILIFSDNLKKSTKKNFLLSLKEISIILLLVFFIMLAGYQFQFKPLKSAMPEHYVERAYEEFDSRIDDPLLKNSIVYTFEKIPIPFPGYFFNIGAVGFTSVEGTSSFFNGKVFLTTPWYFPLAAFFYKTQVSLLILFAFSLIFFNKIKSKNPFNEYIQILPMIAIFVLFILSNTSAGLRHILPVYPFLFLFCSKVARLKKGWINATLIVLLVHYIIVSLLIFPHYLAYFNEFAGGPANGYKHLVGSNLDFGQDLPGLRKFMEENNIEKINLSYFGSIDPKEYVSYDYMPSPYFQHWVPDYVPFVTVTQRYEDCSSRVGWVAISVTNLQNVHLINKTCFNWLKEYDPVAEIGYSIFVYNLDSTKPD